jgi:Tol biopolymer transport system component
VGTLATELETSEVRDQVSRIVESPSFANARRLRDLLNYLVEAALAGRGGDVKEYAIATEALGRSASFDPRIDPIARVEASRLRAKLEHYYATIGAGDPVVICLPKGGYALHFRKAEGTSGSVSPSASSRRPIPAGRWPLAAVVAIGVFAATLFTGSLIRLATPTYPEAPVIRFEAALGGEGELSHQVGSSLAISPDGKSLAMLLLKSDGATRLHVRRLESLEAVELPGTAGAYAPFFSPDGKWVAFYGGAKLKKTLADGSGSPIVLADVSDFLGGAWLESGEIILANARRNMLWRLPGAGGPLEPLFDYGGEAQSLAAPRWAEELPGGRGILFTAQQPEGYAIEFVNTDGRGRKPVVSHGFYPRYTASGHLLYVDNGTLYAVKFDPDRVETVGEAWPIVRDVAFSEGFGSAHYDVSDTGTLVYWREPSAGSFVLSRITPHGSTPLINQPARYAFPRVSPDGQKVAFAVGAVSTSDLFIYDIATRARIRVENSSGELTFPLWSPDGRHLLSTDQNIAGIAWRSADGAEPGRKLLAGVSIPFSMTRDGQRLAYYKMGQDTVFDLWTVPLTEGPQGLTAGPEARFRATPFVETYPAFSPDGRWIAYTSNESGGFEIYVRAFPEVDGRVVKVSSNGGRVAYWSNNQILYSASDNRLMSASWSVRDGRFEAGEPSKWSPALLADTGVLPNYSASPDGRTIIGLTPVDELAPRDRVVVVQNIFTELQRGPN